MALAALPGLTLHYEERGLGRPLLLIAGIPAIASDWRPLAARLADGARRVLAYDNRGSGRELGHAGPIFDRADGRATRSRCSTTSASSEADVFGMSMGGMIAQELALLAPARVRRLVLGCTHAGVAHASPPPAAAGRAFALATDDWALRMRTLAPFAFAERRRHASCSRRSSRRSRATSRTAPAIVRRSRRC